MTKNEYLNLTNSERVNFLNKYIGKTKKCKEENEFVWGFATGHCYSKYDENKKEYVELTEEEIQNKQEENSNKNKNKNNNEKRKTESEVFTADDIIILKPLIENSKNILDFAGDYKLSQYFALSKNKYEVVNNLSTGDKTNKCFRVNTNLLEQVNELKNKLNLNDSDLINYALYLLIKTEQ